MKPANILTRNFSVDLRSLAITRIAFGILIFTDLFIRSRYLRDFYTDEGVLSTSALKSVYEVNYYNSIHAISGDYYFQLALFLLAVFFGFLLLIGFFTRIATIISLVLLVSLNMRNPLLLQGGDTLFRCLLFWGMFAPWGERFSVDSFFKKNKYRENIIFSMGAFAFILQIMLMYFFTGLLKTGDPWREDYTAIYYALSIDHFSFLLGPYLYNFPRLMKGMTFFVIWIELLLPFVLLIPYKSIFFRYLLISIFFIFQLGLSLTMKIGLFPWINMAALMILLPPSFWEFLPTLQKKIDRIFLNLSQGIKCYFNEIEQWYYYRAEFPRILNIFFSVIIVFLLVFVLLWNLGHSYENNFAFMKKFKNFAIAIQLKQKWNMFAPRPYTSDGWYVIVGLLENGEIVDVFRDGKEVSWDPPEDRKKDYPSYRWRKFMRNIFKKKHSRSTRYYAKYLCKKWNSNPDKSRLKEMDMYFVSEYNLPDYKVREPRIRKRFSFECMSRKN